MGRRSGGYFAPACGAWFHTPSEFARDHSPTDLRGHFVVARQPTVAPSSWSRSELDGWLLFHDEALPVCRLADETGTPVGWLLGHAVDVGKRRIVTGEQRIAGRCDEPGFERAFRDWLYAHGGRFAALLLRFKPRAYVDSFGSLPVLFEPQAKRLASSPFLLVDPGAAVPDSPLVDVVDPFGTSQFYPFVETCHRDAQRLLPSHALDLVTFEQTRIWPDRDPQPLSSAEAVELIGSIIEAVIEAAVATGGAVLGLTAGGDSRLMLACAREIVSDLRLYTLAFPDLAGRSDGAMAKRIAGTLGLDWCAIPWVDSSDEDIRLWFYRTGALSGSSRGRRSTRTYAQLAESGKPIRLSGIGVELGRGVGWNVGIPRGAPPDTLEKRLRGADLLPKLGIRPHPLLEAAGDRWLEGVHGLDAFDTLDLSQLESKGGGWAGPLTLGYPDAFTTTIYPFAHRWILDATRALSWEYRRDDRLRREIIAARWPELMSFPFNYTSSALRVRSHAERLVQLPGGAVRRVRRSRVAGR